MHYFVVNGAGQPCGHTHRDMGPRLAACWRKAGKATSAVRYRDSQGNEGTLADSALAPVRALLPTRPVGRPPSVDPVVVQGKPLYLRLSVDERARFDALAKGAGVELGQWAKGLMEAAANSVKSRKSP